MRMRWPPNRLRRYSGIVNTYTATYQQVVKEFRRKAASQTAPPPQKKWPLHLEDPGPTYNWTHPNPHPERHLDRFIRFVGLMIVSETRTETDRHTHTQRHRVHENIGNNRPQCMRCGLTTR